MKAIRVTASVILTAYVMISTVIAVAVMIFGGTLKTGCRVGFGWPAYPWILGYIK